MFTPADPKLRVFSSGVTRVDSSVVNVVDWKTPPSCAKATEVTKHY